MQRGATKRQKELLSLIYNSYKNDGYPPNFDELKEKLNISSNQAIIDHLVSLERKGLISREEKSARSIKIKPLGYGILGVNPLFPIVGTSYAGVFTEAIEIQGKWAPASGHVQKLEEETFLIKISGDSMVNAGILEGDHLLVKAQKEFVSGDIVLAQTSEGTTVKRFISQDSPPYLYLKPENPKHKIILFTPEVEMQGKIIGKFEKGIVGPITQGRFL